MTSTTNPSTESRLPLNAPDPIDEKNQLSESDKLQNGTQRKVRRRTTKRSETARLPEPCTEPLEPTGSTTNAADQANTHSGVKRHRMIKSSSFQSLQQIPDTVQRDEQSNTSPKTQQVTSVAPISRTDDACEANEQQPVVSGEHRESNTDGTECFSQSTPDSQQELDLLIGSLPSEVPRGSRPRNDADSQLIRSQLILKPFEEMELGEPCRRRSKVHGGHTNK